MTNDNIFMGQQRRSAEGWQPSTPGGAQTPNTQPIHWPLGRTGSSSDMQNGRLSAGSSLPPIISSEIDSEYESGLPGDPPSLRQLGISGYSRIRFLNASVGFPPLSISVDTQPIIDSLAYQELSEYEYITEGFRKLTIISAESPRTIFYQQSIPFVPGELVTYVLINNGNRLDAVRVPETLCIRQPAGFSCIRMANFSFHSGSVDLILQDGGIVFSGVLMKEATTFRRIRRGSYQFHVINNLPYLTTDIETVNNIPMDISENYIPGLGEVDILVSFQLDIKPATSYTIYLMGVEGGDPGTSVFVVED